MAYILDTQILLWLEESPDKISSDAGKIIFSGNSLFLSIASVWEISIKRSVSKLTISKSTPDFIESFLNDYSASILSPILNDIYQVEYLPLIHRDPFDRLIIAQSLVHQIPIISSDKIFDSYSVQRIW